MLKLEIITPEKKVLSEEVSSLIIPDNQGGEMGILPQHAALVTLTQGGVLTYDKAGVEVSMEIGSGIIEVSEDTVNILVAKVG